MDLLSLDKKLVKKYDLNGPRYTSYPTANMFTKDFGTDELCAAITASNQFCLPKPLSLYVHLPFCNTVCFYCACNKIITANKKHITPYLKDLYKEIIMKGKIFDKDRKVEQIHFGGGTPTYLNKLQLTQLMDVLNNNFNLLDDDSGDYSIEIDPRKLKSETITLLRNLGFNRVSIGVQDFDSEVQAAINRIQTYDETLSIINEARKRNFKSVNIDLIYGLPKQTIKSFTETIRKVININPDRIAIYNFAYLPNLFKTQRQIKKEDLPTPEIKLKIFNETIRLLTSAGYIYIGMDHFAKKNDALAIAQDQGKLHRNFQGYSTNSDCDVIGFGITGISKINNTYSQNLKSLEEYHAIISDKQTPVLHGYQLTFDDEIRREVISQLMCHFKIEFDDIEYMYEINFNDYFSNELNILTSYENDRLLTINYNSIKISPKGRLLIRNICTVFDAYFGKNIISYSKTI